MDESGVPHQGDTSAQWAHELQRGARFASGDLQRVVHHGPVRAHGIGRECRDGAEGRDIETFCEMESSDADGHLAGSSPARTALMLIGPPFARARLDPQPL